VFPRLVIPVGGVIRPGDDYAIVGLLRLAHLGNTEPWSTTSLFRVPRALRGLPLAGARSWRTPPCSSTANAGRQARRLFLAVPRQSMRGLRPLGQYRRCACPGALWSI